MIGQRLSHGARTRKWSTFLVFSLMIAVGTALILVYFSTRPDGDVAAPVTTVSTVRSGATPQTALRATVQATRTASPPSPVVYVVQQGDTLGAIALEHAVTVEDIVALNSLTDPNVLHIGQELRIPAPVLPESELPELTQTQENLPTPLPSPTSIGPPIIEIAQVLGSGHASAEIVMVRNRGGQASLEGWTLSNEKGSVYTLPNLTLFSGGQITIHTGTGETTPKDLYWGQAQAAWSPGELLQLRDNSGEVVDGYIVP